MERCFVFLKSCVCSYENIGAVAFIDELAQEMKTFTAAWITFFAFSSIFIVYNEGGTPAPKRCAVPDCSGEFPYGNLRL